MRRYFSFLLIVALLGFIGCEITYYPITITNNSSKTVSYFYNGSTDTLEPTKSKSYQVKAYTQMPVNFSVVSSETLTVTMVNEREEYIFKDIDPINLNVVNMMPFPVTIKAGNYIDADGTGSGEIGLLIPENTENQNAKIYTTRPKFTITADYPINSIKIEWRMVDTTIYVIIK
jgi:uncharacterized protein YkuJ